MHIIHKKLTVSGTREQVRRQVILGFLSETPGTGKGELTTRYIYEVEKTTNGESIVLKRPAPLNKGMDFIVHTVRTRFLIGKRLLTNPSHATIIEDLCLKQREDTEKMKIVLGLITDIYLCKKITLRKNLLPVFLHGYDIEMILKVIKWLFIEQDVTYWNWSGREMLYSEIQARLI